MEEDFYCVITALEELADHYGTVLPAVVREILKKIIEQERGLDDHHLPELFELLLQFFPVASSVATRPNSVWHRGHRCWCSQSWANKRNIMMGTARLWWPDS